MARHNREARGQDQRGYDYEISYQPDWVRQIKITRTLESGRQSTKTLFRNPGYKEQPPGARVRTRIDCGEQALGFEIEVDDPEGVISKVIVVTKSPQEKAVKGEDETLEFTIENRMPPPPPPGDDGDGGEDGEGG